MLLVCCTLQSCNSTPNKSAAVDKTNGLYFDQSRPDTTPQVFAPGIISKPDRFEFGCTFSKDGKDFYFGVSNDDKMEIYHTKLENGVWSKQKNMFPNDSCSYNDPMLSIDEKRLYFISNRPIHPKDTLKDIDIWYLERDENKWDGPFNLGPPVNNDLDQYYSSFTNRGELYFASKDTVADAPRYAFDIYKSSFNDGEFMKPEKLGDAINTNRYEADVFIAPDESYMIFCSIRRDGCGSGDLYISFKDQNNEWTTAKNMGERINTDKHELCPYVTADGKYFFYTSNQDIYWVSTEILNLYKD